MCNLDVYIVTHSDEGFYGNCGISPENRGSNEIRALVLEKQNSSYFS